MTLQELLNKTRGDFELTIFWEGHDMKRVCEDEEIPDYDPDIDGRRNWADWLRDWDKLKSCRVTEIRLAPNRNYNGAAVWVTIAR